MVEQLSNFNDKLVLLEEKLGKFLFALIIVLVFMAAALRFMGISIAWSIEISQLFFGWITFLGADLALRKKEHIGIDVIVKLFSEKIQTGIYLLHYLVISIFLLVVIYYGFQLTFNNWARSFHTINLSYSFATMSVPIGSALMVRTVIEKVIKGDLLPKSYD